MADDTREALWNEIQAFLIRTHSKDEKEDALFEAERVLTAFNARLARRGLSAVPLAGLWMGGKKPGFAARVKLRAEELVDFDVVVRLIEEMKSKLLVKDPDGGSGEPATKPKATRGRKFDTDQKADRKLHDDWKASSFRKYQDFATARGIKAADVREAVDRHRQRLRKLRNK